MEIPPHLLEKMVKHALRDDPHECCGMVAVRDGVAEAVHPVRNELASPFKFRMEAQEQLRAWNAIEDSGADVAMYHSHTRSAPRPSQTDINLAPQWPGVEWIIIGIHAGEPEVRSYLIEDGAVTEVELT